MRFASMAFASSLTVLLGIASCSSSEPTPSTTNVTPVDREDAGSGPPTTERPPTEDAGTPDPTTPDAEPPPPPPPPVVDTTLVTTSFDGRTRTYYLSVPHGYDANKKYPLVVNFHGNPGTAAGQMAGLPFETASKGEAILAYPDAIDQNWDLYRPTASNNDMLFIQALPAEIAKSWSVDLTRVYGFGYSGGAFFINQLTCRLGGTFRAIASHSGGAPYETVDPQKDPQGYLICPGGKIASLIMHGANDTEVTPDSGEWAALHRAHVNGCQAAREATTPAPCQNQVACPASYPVKFCMVPGVGHGVWSEGLKASWEFFQSVP